METTTETKARTLEDVNLEYRNYCVRLGELAWHIGRCKSEAKEIHSKIMVLDQEAASLKKANAEKE